MEDKHVDWWRKNFRSPDDYRDFIYPDIQKLEEASREIMKWDKADNKKIYGIEKRFFDMLSEAGKKGIQKMYEEELHDNLIIELWLQWIFQLDVKQARWLKDRMEQNINLFRVAKIKYAPRIEITNPKRRDRDKKRVQEYYARKSKTA